MALVLQGGRVLDPGRDLDGMMDVRIEQGRIGAIGPDLPTAGADVRHLRDLVVTPGLVDGHVHRYDGVGFAGIDPDTVGQPAEVSVFRVEDAEWAAQDSVGGRIRARQRIVPLLAVRGDDVFEPVEAARP